MKEADWVAADLAMMLEYVLHGPDAAEGSYGRLFAVSDRRLRLFGHALWEAYRRRGYLPPPASGFEQTVRLNLAWIDGLIGRTQDNDWNLHTMAADEFARDAVMQYTKAGIRPVRNVMPVTIKANRQRVPIEDAAAMLRDVVGNPFRPYTHLAVGDVVEAVPPHGLACGSGVYPHAVVVSIDPFALVSEEGDMSGRRPTARRRCGGSRRPSTRRLHIGDGRATRTRSRGRANGGR